MNFKESVGNGSSKNPPLCNLAKAYKFLTRRFGKEPMFRCVECPSDEAQLGGRLYLCINCVYVCCKSHLNAHTENTGHNLFIDVASKHVFCKKCDDYVYDPEFERVALTEKAASVSSSLTLDGFTSPWAPKNAKEKAVLQKHIDQNGVISSSLSAGLGLRGLCNLGNTCYTSCIIQALIHNPLLRNYFLGGMHKKSMKCKTLSREKAPDMAKSFKPGDKIEARWKSSPKWYPGSIVKVVQGVNGADETYEVLYDDGDTEYGVQKKYIRPLGVVKREMIKSSNGESCLGCTISNLFFEMYSGLPTHVAPYNMLYGVWQRSEHLAGYSQQDAHEFFIALLDGLHEHLGGKADVGCDSIIHRIFTGALQSDVTCASCSAVSTTIDPFWDISLDIRPMAHAATPQKGDGDRYECLEQSGAMSMQGTAEQVDVVNTLHDCLQRYTRTEQLSTSINCVKCGDRQPATKRMSMSTLPAVVVFHLKRFEHGHGKASTKINTPVKFPEQLDLKPYLAERNSSNGKTTSNEKIDSEKYLYSLYCVVNHHGSLGSGHYTNFVRQAQSGGQWFLCDDEHIRIATISEVLASEGYMLFYIKQQLDYE